MTQYANELATIALSYAGCGAQRDTARFLDLVAPLGPGPERAHFARRNVPGDTNSSCGVVGVGFVRELLRRHGRTDLDKPMTLGWWGEATALAKRCGAYRTRGRPGFGALVHVALGSAQHWFTVASEVAADGSFTSVDGGQKDAQGFQLILQIKRRFVGNVEAVSGKPVVEWIDVPALVAALLAGAVAAPTIVPIISTTPAKGSSAVAGSGGSPSPIRGLQGIDISGHNVVTDWKQVVGAVSFVYVKAGEGTAARPPYEDKACARHCAGARSVGLPFGLYHYLRVRDGRPDERVQDGREQADDFVRVLEREKPTLRRPVLDVETASQGAASPLEYLEAIGEFRGRCEELLGMRPVFYTYPGFWSSHEEFSGALALADDPLWIADYSHSKPIVPRPWEDWTLWQWAGGEGRIGAVPGVAGVVDRNVFRGTVEELKRL